MEVDKIAQRAFENPLLDGLTFSGGEPFMQCKALCYLAELAIQRGLNIIAYTGFTWEKLILDKDAMELIKLCKYIIDGPFILEQKSLMLNFRGSQNQRIIDVEASLKDGKVHCAEM